MKLNELPIGTCWLTNHGNREIAVLVRGTTVLYFDDNGEITFDAEISSGHIRPMFIPVGLV